MFVSDKLKVSTQDVYTNMLEYDVYHYEHNYYMTERFELCALTANKYIFNHIKQFDIINHVAMHLLQIQETEEPLFIVKNVKVEDKTWEKLNNKRLNLYKAL